VHTNVDSVIGHSYICCHSALYSLNNLSVIFFVQLHLISEYCRILNTLHRSRLYANKLTTRQYCPRRDDGRLGGAYRI